MEVCGEAKEENESNMAGWLPQVFPWNFVEKPRMRRIHKSEM